MAVLEEWDLGFDMGEEEIFVSLPPGQYKARCDKIDRKEAKSGGFHNLFWKMVVTEGDYKNQSIQGITTLKPDVPHIGLLQACAALRPDMEPKGTRMRPSDYIGHTCLIEVKPNKYTDNSGVERENTRLETWLPLQDSPNMGAKEEKSSADGATFE